MKNEPNVKQLAVAFFALKTLSLPIIGGSLLYLVLMFEVGALLPFSVNVLLLAAFTLICAGLWAWGLKQMADTSEGAVEATYNRLGVLERWHSNMLRKHPLQALMATGAISGVLFLLTMSESQLVSLAFVLGLYGVILFLHSMTKVHKFLADAARYYDSNGVMLPEYARAGLTEDKL